MSPDPSAPWRALTEHLTRACAPAGLDLVQPFAVGWYNARVPDAYRAPDFGRDDALALVIGNTRALWPKFLRAVAEDPALAHDPNPLDQYCRRAVTAAASATSAAGPAWDARFAPDPPPRRVAIQTAAHVSGLAALSDAQLCVHPTHGPWIALRAVVVFDAAGPRERPELRPPCDCAAGCAPAMAAALAASSGPDGAPRPLAETWRLWLAVRDACPAGRQSRYSDDQIRYHYLKRRELLNSGQQ